MLPEKIYKYEKLDMYTLANLKNNQIWFSNVNDFNDPFEITMTVDTTNFSKENIISILKKRGITNLNLDDTEAKRCKNAAVDVINERIDMLKKSNGITCFSEKNDDILMWSHYADKHKGICLEFSTKYEPFNKIRKVKYSATYPKLPIDIDKIGDKFLEGVCTKSDRWEYEKEWRLIHEECSKLYGYSNECLTGIYFGAKMEYVYKEIVSLIIQGQNRNVKFYDGKLSKNSFNVKFKPVEYTPYIELHKSN